MDFKVGVEGQLKDGKKDQRESFSENHYICYTFYRTFSRENLFEKLVEAVHLIYIL